MGDVMADWQTAFAAQQEQIKELFEWKAQHSRDASEVETLRAEVRELRLVVVRLEEALAGSADGEGGDEEEDGQGLEDSSERGGTASGAGAAQVLDSASSSDEADDSGGAASELGNDASSDGAAAVDAASDDALEDMLTDGEDEQELFGNAEYPHMLFRLLRPGGEMDAIQRQDPAHAEAEELFHAHARAAQRQWALSQGSDGLQRVLARAVREQADHRAEVNRIQRQLAVKRGLVVCAQIERMKDMLRDDHTRSRDEIVAELAKESLQREGDFMSNKVMCAVGLLDHPPTPKEQLRIARDVTAGLDDVDVEAILARPLGLLVDSCDESDDVDDHSAALAAGEAEPSAAAIDALQRIVGKMSGVPVVPEPAQPPASMTPGRRRITPVAVAPPAAEACAVRSVGPGGHSGPALSDPPMLDGQDQPANATAQESVPAPLAAGDGGDDPGPSAQAPAAAAIEPPASSDGDPGPRSGTDAAVPSAGAPIDPPTPTAPEGDGCSLSGQQGDGHAADPPLPAAAPLPSHSAAGGGGGNEVSAAAEIPEDLAEGQSAAPPDVQEQATLAEQDACGRGEGSSAAAEPRAPLAAPASNSDVRGHDGAAADALEDGDAAAGVGVSASAARDRDAVTIGAEASRAPTADDGALPIAGMADVGAEDQVDRGNAAVASGGAADGGLDAAAAVSRSERRISGSGVPGPASPVSATLEGGTARSDDAAAASLHLFIDSSQQSGQDYNVASPGEAVSPAKAAESPDPFAPAQPPACSRQPSDSARGPPGALSYAWRFGTAPTLSALAPWAQHLLGRFATMTTSLALRSLRQLGALLRGLVEEEEMDHPVCVHVVEDGGSRFLVVLRCQSTVLTRLRLVVSALTKQVETPKATKQVDTLKALAPAAALPAVKPEPQTLDDAVVDFFASALRALADCTLARCAVLHQRLLSPTTSRPLVHADHLEELSVQTVLRSHFGCSSDKVSICEFAEAVRSYRAGSRRESVVKHSVDQAHSACMSMLSWEQASHVSAVLNAQAGREGTEAPHVPAATAFPAMRATPTGAPCDAAAAPSGPSALQRLLSRASPHAQGSGRNGHPARPPRQQLLRRHAEASGGGRQGSLPPTAVAAFCRALARQYRATPAPDVAAKCGLQALNAVVQAAAVLERGPMDLSPPVRWHGRHFIDSIHAPVSAGTGAASPRGAVAAPDGDERGGEAQLDGAELEDDLSDDGVAPDSTARRSRPRGSRGATSEAAAAQSLSAADDAAAEMLIDVESDDETPERIEYAGASTSGRRLGAITLDSDDEDDEDDDDDDDDEDEEEEEEKEEVPPRSAQRSLKQWRGRRAATEDAADEDFRPEARDRGAMDASDDEDGGSAADSGSLSAEPPTKRQAVSSGNATTPQGAQGKRKAPKRLREELNLVSNKVGQQLAKARAASTPVKSVAVREDTGGGGSDSVPLFDDAPQATVPASIKSRLKPWQLEGIHFMWKLLIEEHEAEGLAAAPDGEAADAPVLPGGAILAHTMGAGKTLQAIVMIMLFHTVEAARARASGGADARRTVVVVPKNVLCNWMAEFKTWLTKFSVGSIEAGAELVTMTTSKMRLEVRLVEGGQAHAKKRKAAVDAWLCGGAAEAKAGALPLGTVLLCTYSGLKTLWERSADEATFGTITQHADLVVADEAHEIKNPDAQVSKAMWSFQTRRKLAMSGHPLMNSLEEFFNMINWAYPHYLGPKAAFERDYITPINAGRAQNATRAAKSKMRRRAALLEHTVAQLIHRVGPSVLQSQLPEKLELCLALRLPACVETLYTTLLAAWLRHVGRSRMFQLAQLADLLMSTPHTFVAQMALASAGNADAAALDDVEDAAEANDDEDRAKGNKGDKPKGPPRAVAAEMSAAWDAYVASHPRTDLAFASTPKGALVLQLARECVDGGTKMLVFTKLRSVQREIFDAVSTLTGRAARPGAPRTLCLRMDGEASTERRHETVNRFQRHVGSAVLVMTIKACALGINLTAATRAVIFDSSWNPMFASQAASRCHRIGQERPVTVYRLVYDGTCDHKVQMRSLEKEALFKGVVDSAAVRAVLTDADWATWDYTPTASGAAVIEDGAADGVTERIAAVVAAVEGAPGGAVRVAQARQLSTILGEDKAMKLNRAGRRLVLERAITRLASKAAQAPPRMLHNLRLRSALVRQLPAALDAASDGHGSGAELEDDSDDDFEAMQGSQQRKRKGGGGGEPRRRASAPAAVAKAPGGAAPPPAKKQCVLQERRQPLTLHPVAATPLAAVAADHAGARARVEAAKGAAAAPSTAPPAPRLPPQPANPPTRRTASNASSRSHSDCTLPPTTPPVLNDGVASTSSPQDPVPAAREASPGVESLGGGPLGPVRSERPAPLSASDRGPLPPGMRSHRAGGKGDGVAAGGSTSPARAPAPRPPPTDDMQASGAPSGGVKRRVVNVDIHVMRAVQAAVHRAEKQRCAVHRPLTSMAPNPALQAAAPPVGGQHEGGAAEGVNRPENAAALPPGLPHAGRPPSSSSGSHANRRTSAGVEAQPLGAGGPALHGSGGPLVDEPPGGGDAADARGHGQDSFAPAADKGQSSDAAGGADAAVHAPAELAAVVDLTEDD